MGKGEQTRLAVLEQAADVAARQGLSTLTIGDLAARTRLSKSGLFAHFQSKEALQLAVLAFARDKFTDEVIRPATRTPRGEARVRALFENWLEVSQHSNAECLFVSASSEFDDQPGPVRDQLVRDHRDCSDSIMQMFRTGVTGGDFREDADAEQFSYDLHGIMLSFFHTHRLLGDPRAPERARRAFETLLAAARAH
ncbi:MAG TPA: TetR/AcrR family transcriptional regulator [Actinospica sp.]|jgi:AcrR family transcriptional regulator|nr:TetR/AcrR family transcriptional regulator [Actinospica sp.]